MAKVKVRKFTGEHAHIVLSMGKIEPTAKLVGVLTRSIPDGADGITLDGRPLYIEDAPKEEEHTLVDIPGYGTLIVPTEIYNRIYSLYKKGWYFTAEEYFKTLWVNAIN